MTTLVSEASAAGAPGVEPHDVGKPDRVGATNSPGDAVGLENSEVGENGGRLGLWLLFCEFRGVCACPALRWAARCAASATAWRPAIKPPPDIWGLLVPRTKATALSRDSNSAAYLG